ncbi:adenylyl-sulfate kinase [Candidatus Parcubacteria bacterium]|nr:MAG: adenylyl-sulfate kinase [Candidatus Parcubacteria bacterium]
MTNNNKKGFVLWFTGFSAAGKTTIADKVHELLKHNGNRLERLDGDIVRKNLTQDLGFSKEDRDENIRRIGFVANLLSRNDIGVIASFISPYRAQREMLRENVTNFIEIFVDAPIEVCESRDPKGMYKKARAGELKNFTGVDDPYEPPENPDIHLLSSEHSPDDLAKVVLSFLRTNDYID